MSAKNVDRHNRYRSVVVGFRMSPEESEKLNTFVRVSGLTKQDYLIRRVLHREVTVVGSSRVLKALRTQTAELLTELKRIEAGQSLDEDLLEVIQYITDILRGMEEDHRLYK